MRELRLAAGLTQQDLGQLIGVSRNAVSQWEADETQPSTKRLLMLSRALKVPIDKIMAPSGETRDRVIDLATRLFSEVGFEEISPEVICTAAGLSRLELDATFDSKESLLFDVGQRLAQRSLQELRRDLPQDGDLASRLRYLLRNRCAADCSHIRITRAFLSYSWRWNTRQETDYEFGGAALGDLILELFDRAAELGEIRAGDYRAASELVLAAYQCALRKNSIVGGDPDQVMQMLEPQLNLVLAGIGFSGE